MSRLDELLAERRRLDARIAAEIAYQVAVQTITPEQAAENRQTLEDAVQTDDPYVAAWVERRARAQAAA